MCKSQLIIGLHVEGIIIVDWYKGKTKFYKNQVHRGGSRSWQGGGGGGRGANRLSCRWLGRADSLVSCRIF